MRSLRLVNLPDGKVRMLCQMTKRRAEELKRQGIAVELIAPVDKVSGTSRRRAQKSRVHSELTLLDYREIQALLSAGGSSCHLSFCSPYHLTISSMALRFFSFISSAG